MKLSINLFSISRKGAAFSTLSSWLIGVLVLVVISLLFYPSVLNSYETVDLEGLEQQCLIQTYKEFDVMYCATLSEQSKYIDENSGEIPLNLEKYLCDGDDSAQNRDQRIREELFYAESECSKIGEEECSCLMNAHLYQRNEFLSDVEEAINQGSTLADVLDGNTVEQEENLFDFFRPSLPSFSNNDGAVNNNHDVSFYTTRAIQEFDEWESNNWVETSPTALPSLTKYWEASQSGLDWTPSHTPWSAAFISYVVNGDFSSSSHSVYIKNVKDGNVEGWDFQFPEDGTVSLGDVVCAGRKNKEMDTTYQLVKDREYQPGYPSHCDIVVEIDNNGARLIGGNVNNRVAEKFFELDLENKLVIDKEYIAILKNNNQKAQPSFDGDVGQLLSQFSTEYNIELAKLQAIVDVETKGKAFEDDGHPRVRFECHVFNKKFSPSQPCTIGSGGYSKVSSETNYAKFNEVLAINRDGAIHSTSFGAYQIMGFNYKVAGYNSYQDFYEDSKTSEGQVKGFITFLINYQNGAVLRELQSDDTNWAEVARRYNGPEYAEHNYDGRLKSAYENFRSNS